MMKRILYTYILLFAVFTASGQKKVADAAKNNIDSITTIMHIVKQEYARKKYLRFAMRYTYASSTAPSAIKDSLNGFVQLHNNNYSVRLNNTESIQTQNRLVTLYSDEMLMYISAGRADASHVPVHSLIDTALIHTKDISCCMYDSSHFTNIRIAFPDDNMYKSMLLCIDKQNKLLVSAQYLLKTEALLSNEEIEQGLRANAKPDPYSIVQISFLNYDTSAFDTNIFNEANYFTVEGDSMQVTNRYAAYQLFNANVKAL